MGVHELDQVLANAAAAVAAHTTTVDVAPPAACSSGHEAQAQAKRLTAAPPTRLLSPIHIGPPAQRRAVHKVRQRWNRGNPNMRGLATRASWASTCLAGASRLESLLLYAESPPAIYFGTPSVLGDAPLRSRAVSAVPDHGECKT